MSRGKVKFRKRGGWNSINMISEPVELDRGKPLKKMEDRERRKLGMIMMKRIIKKVCGRGRD
jgi:hypothetical protein